MTTRADTQARGEDTLGESSPSRTRVEIRGDRFFISDQVTYPGAPAEGRLMNVRAVNAVFEDASKPDFDPEANTSRFIAEIPEYGASGVRAFTLNLQGGWPGYEGAVNSAFDADGALKPGYMARVRRVIEACDRAGVCVILGYFYQRQDQRLRDEAAVRAAVVNATKWVRANGFANVLIEIANEFEHQGFEHELIRSPAGQVELMRLVRQTAPGLYVSASGLGNGRMPDEVAEAADFILPHFNDTPVQDMPARATALRRFGKPVVCNEDDKVGAAGAEAARRSVANGLSWGLMAWEVNQRLPFQFDGSADDTVVYAALRELTL